MIARRSVRLVRWWVDLYTRGLSADARDGRREEIDGDLWSQFEDATLTGQPDRSTEGEILVRLLFGVPADVSWRLTRGIGSAARPSLEKSTSMSTRVLGLFAILGGLGVTIGAVVFAGAMLGDSSLRPWEGDLSPIQTWTMAVAGTVGIIAVAVATVGLVVRFRDLASKRAAAAATIGAVCGVLGVLVAWPAIYLAPVGMAYFIWDLGRAGVLSRWLAAAQAASVVAVFVPLVAIWTDVSVEPAIVLVIPYWITWLAIGSALLRGASGAPPAVQGA
jgi:hypothetical protein